MEALVISTIGEILASRVIKIPSVVGMTWFIDYVFSMMYPKQAAFSLVELIMVLVISGILAAVAFPKFFDQNNFAERVFFDDTVNAVRYAQKLAVATGCSVQFAVSSDSYSLTRQGSASSTACPGGASYSLAVPHPGTGSSSYTGSEPGVSLSSSAAVFSFNALGEASTDVTLTVNGSRTLVVVAETGLVYVP